MQTLKLLQLHHGPKCHFITRPPNGPVFFARWRLLSSVMLPAGGRAGRRARGRSTLHGGPVQLRPVRATPCFGLHLSHILLDFYIFCTTGNRNE